MTSGRVVLVLGMTILVAVTTKFTSQALFPNTHMHTHTQQRNRQTTLGHDRRRVLRLFMGLKVTIRIVGRKQGGEDWLEEACDMYLTRLKPTGLEVLTEWHKTDAALLKGISADQDKNTPIVLLDPVGKRVTSEKLTDNIYQWLEQGGSRLVFVIGGAEGLPNELKDGSIHGNKPFDLLSLSELTFTHQFARLVLLEQIYRATEIRKGSGYHK